MSMLGLMVLRTLNKKKWEIFSHFFLFSTFILPQIGRKIKSCTVLRLGVINIEDNLRQYRIIEQE